jgi:hypothetical protein
MDRSKEAPFFKFYHPSSSPSPQRGEGKGGENERRKKWIRKKNRF